MPLWDVPDFSISFGISAKTEGGYPLTTGGSPTVRPISRWAIAQRVTESIIRVTSRPCSRKYSAMAVATQAALIRCSAG